MKPSPLTVAACLLALAATAPTLAGCGGENNAAPPAAAPPPAPSPSVAPAPATFADQVTLGGQLYSAHCARCHGASGEGTKDGPAVVGLAKGALPLDPPPTAKYRKNKFETVADVAAFVTKAMPPDNPGGLSPEQYWAILAFDLKANGIDLGAKKLDASLASTLKIPR